MRSVSWVVANGFRMLTTVRAGALECSQPFAAVLRGEVRFPDPDETADAA